MESTVITGSVAPCVLLIQRFVYRHGLAAQAAIIHIAVYSGAVGGVLGGTFVQRKRRFAAVFCRVGIGVFALYKHGGHNLAAGIGRGGHGKGKGGICVKGTVAGQPAAEDPTLIGRGCHGGGNTALAYQLAGRTGQYTAALHDEFQRDFGIAHGDGILLDQIDRYAHGGWDSAQGLGASILRDVGVGAYILKQRCYGGFGKMHTVRQCVVLFGPACGFVPQDLGGVQKLEVVIRTHRLDGGVVGVHLHHVQAGVAALLVQRGNGADNDIAVGPGLANGFQTL